MSAVADNEAGSRGADAERTRAAVDDSVAAALRWVRAGGPAWRFGRHPVDRSPWYLVIGQHSAGKSTMLRASGHRPGQRDVAAEPGLRPAPLRWWFRERTIWFETATLDAGDVGDAAHLAGWRALMRRLRRARPRCPADGIVVVVSVEQLVNDDEAARKQGANTLRAYIDIAYRAFKRRVPVYVLVTQCDRLAGFDEFVADLAEDDLDRPLGIVFPAASHLGDEAWATWFARGFESLVSQALRQSIERMPVRADSRRATMVYRFPTSLEALKVPLARFLDEAFAPSSELLEPIWLRSVNLAAVLRRDATPRDDARPPPAAVSARERAGFMGGWLRDVMLAERGLARSRHAMPRRQVLRMWAAAALCIALAACLGLGLASGYRRGVANLEAAIPSTAAFARAARTGIDPGRPSTMLPVLEAARALPCAQQPEGLGGRWLEHLTLVREPHWAAACRDAYRAALQATVLPYLLARTAAALHESNGLPSSQYDALRVYLMLGDKARYDRAAVYAWLAADVQRAADSTLSPRERSAWLAHAAAWAEAAASEPDAPLDAALVAQARTRLQAQPEAQRVFDDVMRALKAPALAPLSVADMAGPGAALVFHRRSGGALSEGVSGAYTLDGARRYLALRDAALARARQERWVLGPATGGPPPARMAAEVDRLYVEGYLAAWDALFADVALRPLPATGDGAAVVKLLASPPSPLRAYLLRAAKETTWGAASPDAAAPAPTSTSTWFGRVGRRLRQWFGASASTPAKAPPPVGQFDDESAARLDRHFDALHRLVASGGAPGPSLLDQAQAQLKEVAVYLQAAGVARASGLAAPPDDALTRLVQDAATLPAPLGDMLEGLGEAGAAAAQSAERARIDARWQADAAGFCHAAVDGRYPFVANAAVDTTLDDFARLFAPGGLLDAFFQANLKPYVDTSTTPWTWRAKLTPPGMSMASLRAFERAARIRQAFFPEQGKTMNVRFTLTGQDSDTALASFALAFGGQTLKLTHDARVAKAFQWPDGSAAPVARIDYAVADGSDPQPIEDRGVWSLFRLLDRGALDALGPDRFTLTFALDGHSVALDLAASSVVNPFALPALRSFRCPSRM
jgi:type VI secretion system protein ImpL